MGQKINLGQWKNKYNSMVMQLNPQSKGNIENETIHF